MKCESNDLECDWEGTVSMLDKHLAMCKFTPIPCPKKCRCLNGTLRHYMRKDLDNHVERFCPNRDYKCSECGEKGTYTSITHTHYQTCEMALTVCPNFQCDKKIQRRRVKRHLEEDCEYKEVSCKYARIGCDAKMTRKDMFSHVQDQNTFHLHLALENTTKVEDANQKLLEKVSNVEKQLKSALVASKLLEKTNLTIIKEKEQNLKSGNLQVAFKFRLSDYGKLKEASRLFTSPSFYTSSNGYHLNVRVNSNGYRYGEGTHVSIFTHVIDGKYDFELSWPIVGNVHFALLNQLEDNNHYVKTYNIHKGQNVRVRRQRGFFEFIPHSALDYHPVTNTQYLKDDTLYFKVAVDFPDNHKPWLNSSAS